MEKAQPGQGLAPTSAPQGQRESACSTSYWPAAHWPKIAYELAVGVDDAGTIAARHGMTGPEMRGLLGHPVFHRILHEAVQEVRETGAGYKAKARAIAEDLLPDLYTIAKNPQVHPSIRVDTAKFLTDVAGMKPGRGEGAGMTGGASRFVLQVILGTREERIEKVIQAQLVAGSDQKPVPNEAVPATLDLP